MAEKNNIPARNASHSDTGGGNKNIETYAEDIAKVVEGGTGRLVKKIIHQEEEHEIEKKNLSPESKKNKFFMFVGILLICTTLTILFYLLFKKNINTVDIKEQFTPIIFYDKSNFLEVSGFNKEKIAQTIYNATLKTMVKVGGVEGVYLTENIKVVGFKRFIALIKSNFVSGNAPDNSSFVNDNFLMGVVNNRAQPTMKRGGHFFILLKVRSVTDVFDSMRAWENKMFLDLHGFFGVSLSSETEHLLIKDFENGIVENKNARILYNNEGKAILMYIFADDNSIIITNTPLATQEIILRLASSQVEK